MHLHSFKQFPRAWACGLVPVAQTVAGNKFVLWNRGQSVGLHYQGSDCCFQSIKAPQGVQVTVFVEFTAKICKFCCNGVVVAIKPVPDAEFPLRLGICGHNGSVFNLKPNQVGDFKDESAKFECFMAAQVGDSVFPVQGPSQRQGLSPLPHDVFAVPSFARGGGAASEQVSVASEISAKQLTCMRLEFSSASEFDLWRRALLHSNPSLKIEAAQSLQKDDASADATAHELSLNLLLNFIPDTRPLCEERSAFGLISPPRFHSLFLRSCYICMERIWFAQGTFHSS